MKAELKCFFIAVLVLLCSSCARTCGNSTGKPRETLPSGILVDVRTPEEFAAGHLQGAILIPYTEIGNVFPGIVSDKSKPVLLYCRSGRRSGIAGETLEDIGYSKVINLGGMGEAACKTGLPVVK